MGQRDILIYLARLFKKYQITYLLTGSFAVSYFGFPRATHDIDFIIEISQKAQKLTIKLIKELNQDFMADIKEIKSKLKKQSMFNLFHYKSGTKIDFWVIESVEFVKKYQRRKTVKIDNLFVNLISAEDLIITKLKWCQEIFSDRHFSDCVGIWQVQKNKLDTDYLVKEVKKAGITKLLEKIKTLK